MSGWTHLVTVLRFVGVAVVRLWRRTRPRGNAAVVGAAWLALAAAVLFFVGAAVTYGMGLFFHLGTLQSDLVDPGSEPERVRRALAGVFAGIQVVLGGVYLLIALRAWRGDAGFLGTFSRGDSLGYALVMLSWVFGGFSLNFLAVLLVTALYGHLLTAAGFEDPSRPPSPDAVLAVLKRRHTPPEGPRVSDPAGGEQPMVGQSACPQCGTPNPVGRRRCRRCATEVSFPVRVVPVRQDDPRATPVPLPLPRKRRRKKIDKA